MKKKLTFNQSELSGKIKKRTMLGLHKEKGDSLYNVSITGNINLHIQDENLVYIRLCPDTLFALGLCTVLKHLSPKSLDLIIKNNNIKKKAI